MSDKESLTEKINNANIASIRKQIAEKTKSTPFYGTSNNVSSITTDMDHFPYTRNFRGIYKSTEPVVFEREAGWRPRQDSCYSVNYCKNKGPYPNHCFETACSTVYPCHPETLQKYSDKEAMLVQLNNNCIMQYR